MSPKGIQYALILIIVPIIISSPNYVVINLDTKTSGTDYSQVSSSLREYLNSHLADFQIQTLDSVYSDPIEVKPNQYITLQINETYALIINTMKFYKDGTEINNYRVGAMIGTSNIPYNYYQGHETNEDADIECIYKNESPQYLNKSIDINVRSVVTADNYNFGLDENNHVVIFQINRETLELQNKANFRSIYSTEEYNSEPLSKIFISQPHFFKEKILFLVYPNNKKIVLFLFIVKQNIGVAVSYRGTIEKNIPENCEINQITHNDKFYFIATSQGLYIYSIVNVNSTQQVCTGEITDLLINKNTLYFIRKNDGLYLLDLSKQPEGYYEVKIFSHTRLEKFDYALYEMDEENSTYFVGIAVNNSPSEGIPEVLIELIAHGDHEYSPKINKIFVTGTNINIKDIATDPYSYFSYIFDRDTKKLYILTRTVPNFQDSLNYVVDLSENIQNSSTSEVDDYLYFVTPDGDEKEQIVAIKTGNTIHLVGKVSRETQLLTCNFKKTGNYSQSLTLGGDCSTYDSTTSNYSLTGCERNYYFSMVVPEEIVKRKRVGLWVALVIGIIITIAIVIGAVCYTFKKKSNLPPEDRIDYKKGPTAEEKPKLEMEEANFDNKL